MLRALAFSCAFLIAGPHGVAAEWHLAPTVGLTFRGNTSIVDLEDASNKVHRQFGGAATLVGGGPLGVEGVFVYTPGLFERGDQTQVKHSRSFALMGNAVLTLPRRWTEYSLRPYVSGGLGLVHVSLLAASGAFPVRRNLAGFDIGGGAVGFLSARTGLRFDLRYFSSLNRTEQGAIAFGPVHLSYMTTSIGIVFRR